ncbi:tRNA (adenosine(37)-N6)-threonylcarbamoyltransferase complex ATPase subunit type 1 TsaE [Actinomyces capricornis]|uniref:tRNA (adenosine(37)-N6)-threonylcarbamoyltransferase complex ATPase subunit type 1 TsaE n=1 Tax=Actinomyces capricornis TaxID=2755559 RepID=UPI001CC368BD|nr:tRNA (adenosine(37)-N6)-threonylcarbamoyltransferase complex ATPase subunit type 1 TsaE [Actinomyces capricornis]
MSLISTDAEDTRALGARLAGLLRAGDLVLLSGGLGAGKTTLAQGIGAALGVRGRVSSPTFVIARHHPALGQGPDLIHVDAYRLDSLEEVDALDLDSSMQESVTLVEWGQGKVESLADNRLEVEVRRPHGGLGAAEPATGPGQSPDLEQADDGRREIVVRALGPRWAGVVLDALDGFGGGQVPGDADD